MDSLPTFGTLILTSFPHLDELPNESVWHPFRGTLSTATAIDSNWRSFPHLQSIDACREMMITRIQEFQELVEVYGSLANIECKICRHRGRSLAFCFSDGLVAAGGRHHLRKLWSAALATGSSGRQAPIWEVAMVPGGAVRFNYVDGAIEVCRGSPPEDSAEPSPPTVSRNRGLRNRTGTWESPIDSALAGPRLDVSDASKSQELTSSASAPLLVAGASTSASTGKGRKKTTSLSRSSLVSTTRSRPSANSGGSEASSSTAGRGTKIGGLMATSLSSSSSRAGGVFALRARRTTSRQGHGQAANAGEEGKSATASSSSLGSAAASGEARSRSKVGRGAGAERAERMEASPQQSRSPGEMPQRLSTPQRHTGSASGSTSGSAGQAARQMANGLPGQPEHQGAGGRPGSRAAGEDAPDWVSPRSPVSACSRAASGYGLAGNPPAAQAGQHVCFEGGTEIFEVAQFSPPPPSRNSKRRGRGNGKAASKNKKSWAGIPDQWGARNSGASGSSADIQGGSTQAASSSGPVAAASPGSPGAASAAGAASTAGAADATAHAAPSNEGCVGREDGAEAEDSEQEERVLLEKRPHGIEISPAEQDGGVSRGAVVRQVEGHAAEVGLEPGSTILCINEQSVEDMITSDIQGLLNNDPMPMTLDVALRPLHGMLVPKRKMRKRDPVIVCTANCRGSHKVVSEAVNQLGWQELLSAADALTKPASVIWAEHADQTDGAAPVQTVSRIEAFLQFCKKVKLAQCLNAWDEALPDTFAFSPKTWILPQDANELRSFMSRCGKEETVIAKPTAGAQGKGIILAKKWKELEGIVSKAKAFMESANPNRKQNPCEYVVQRYLNHPLLLGGLKFDMRLYVVVTSVVPMRAYLFKEGLARFCTVPYKPAEEGNLKEAKMHLTNFAVNKKSKDFQPADAHGNEADSSKRSVSSVLRQIQLVYGIEPEEIWSKVAVLAANTLMALRPGLVEYYVHEAQKPLHPLAPKGFQMIGLDVIIDGDMEPRLLELNANASLSATQPKAKGEPSGSNDEAELRASDSEGDFLMEQPSGSPQKASVISIGGKHEEGPESTDHPSPLMRRGSFAPGVSQRRKLRAASGSARFTQPHMPWEEDQVMISTTSNQSNASAEMGATSSAAMSSTARPGSAGNRRKSLRFGSKNRVSDKDDKKEDKKDKKKDEVVSELDLVIKRELVAQALLLVRPAPHNKCARLKRAWTARGKNDLVALDDEGNWKLSGKPTRSEAVRTDAPDRCPALEPIDFDELAAPEVFEFAKVHLALYRWWAKSCSQGRDSIGQAQVLRMLEKCFLVGCDGALFPDRVSAQLWLSRIWRDLASGNFGLNLPQFIQLAGKLGVMLLGDEAAQEEVSRPHHVPGILEFWRRSLSSGAATETS
eukprot:TRINITY_DN77817_c0_g1_i1.p1 TRINITY_DN77817_c0_g1~~TRINITY_DN77817_c0_g1_i1.p1  ORF type:complete len:1398 (-),score=286.85 TRINITY_DN77817_c0_g1_i1:2-4168(-)